MTTDNGTEFLITEKYEWTKKYCTYDASDRLEYVYVTKANADNGDPCSVTRYVYDGVSARVVKIKEYQGTWVSATMDI